MRNADPVVLIQPPMRNCSRDLEPSLRRREPGLMPLANCKERSNLIFPPNAKPIEFLRALPKLESIGFGFDPKTFLPDQTAVEFWKEYDARK